VTTNGARWRMGRMTPVAVTLSVLVPLALTACTEVVTRNNVLMSCKPPKDRIESGLVLMAQAVPSASVVPCINVYPAGWSLTTFDARTERVDITFDSDRGGLQALIVTLVPSCRATGSALPPDEVGAPNLRQTLVITATTYQATRFYTFPGGCVMFRFDVPLENATALTSDAVMMINLTSRAKIEAEVARFGFTL
jgi:hypothetical protein